MEKKPPQPQPARGFSISSKLIVVNVLVGLAFLATILTVIATSREIENDLTTTVATGVNQVMDNARTGRALTTVFSDLDILLHSFYGDNALLDRSGGILVHRINTELRNTRHLHLKDALHRLSMHLVDLLTQAVNVNENLALGRRSLRMAEQALQPLEEGDTALLGDLPNTLRQDMLRIALLHTQEAAWYHMPLRRTGESQTLDAIDDLVESLSTAMTSKSLPPPLRSRVGAARELLLHHRADTVRLQLARELFRNALGELSVRKRQVMVAMRTIDTAAAATSEILNADIRRTVQASQHGLLALAVVAVTLTWLLAMFFFYTTIKRPMQRMAAGIRAITDGQLDTVVRLGNKDEWLDIETALNAMVNELELSYREIRDKHAEQRATRQALERNVSELERQIDAREEAEQALRDSEAKYRAFFEQSILGMYQASPEGRFLSANRAMARLLGYDSSSGLMEAIKGDATQVFANQEEHERFVQRVAEESELDSLELRLIRKQGQIIWASFSARGVRDADGEMAYIEGTVRDITDRKRAEIRLDVLNRHLKRAVQERTKKLAQKAKELELANQRLLEMDRLKSAFLSGVSHELRTPLTSVLGFAKLIRKDFQKCVEALSDTDLKAHERAERIKGNLAVIYDQANRLTRLINDVLDLNRIEVGRMAWNDEILDVRELVEGSVQAVAGQVAEHSEVRMETRIHDNLPPLLADRDRLEQVLINLLSNACKFTMSGSVTLRVFSPGEDILRFEVQDTGEGIPEDDLNRIFDRFHQVRQGDTLRRQPQGTGLGLAISRDIVEHYHGRIWVESELGRGSTFFVDLPCPKDPRPPQELPPVFTTDTEPDADAPLILVVEDDPPSSALLTTFFKSAGYATAKAFNGRQAVERARALKPSLITMDIMMPVMDGRDAIAALREDPALRDIPVLVVTAKWGEEDSASDATMVKPIRKAALLETVRSLLDKSRSGKPKEILLLDQDGKRTARSASADPKHPILLSPCELAACDSKELWDRLDRGFAGTVVLPDWAAHDLDMARFANHPEVHVVILPPGGES